ncbi:MAG: hypothetical protein D6753_14905 [Planctomycetota bacterium]|nr:MAG: hypothetical protein D6753_14905 [Planctomycetota bacterium]
MPRILLVASFPVDQFLRQTPEGGGVWGDFHFTGDPHRGPFDAVVVYDDCPGGVECEAIGRNTLLITGEPPSLRRYRRPFTSQFEHVWTSHRSIRHPQVRYGHEGQPWHYGLYPSQVHGRQMTFSDLASLRAPQKTKLCSVICSSKTTTEDHRQRLEFVRRLQREFGEQIDVFGRGIRPLKDKSDAIYLYKYHVVMENDHSPFYMTEKLTDAFLGWSYPFYFGGREAEFCFPPGSYTAIDIYRPEVAIGIIRDAMAQGTYERQFPILGQARSKVLQELNLMAMLAEFWQNAWQPGDYRPIRLLPKRRSAALAWRHVQRSVTRPGRAA